MKASTECAFWNMPEYGVCIMRTVTSLGNDLLFIGDHCNSFWNRIMSVCLFLNSCEKQVPIISTV